MLRVDYVNDPRIIAKQPLMTAINSGIEIDITGQVCADSIGTRMYSGFGGQVDFISGAAMSEDGRGKPIIALQSATNKGVSKIVPTLKPGKYKNLLRRPRIFLFKKFYWLKVIVYLNLIKKQRIYTDVKLKKKNLAEDSAFLNKTERRFVF